MLPKKSVIFFALLSLLLISACTTTQTSSSVQGAYSTCYGDDSQMITAEFANFAPVSSESSPYRPGEDIDVEVVLTNKLPSDIDAGKVKVRLTGETAISSIFSGAQVVSADKLYSSDPDTCSLETTEVNIGPIVYEGLTTTKISKTVSGSYCYEEPVVVKGFLYFTADENEIGTNLPSGSNPPSSIQVTQIEQNPVNVDPDKDGELRFKIYLENIGTGTVVPDLDSCFEFREAGYREEFDINVDAPYSVDCPPTGVALSRDERADVVTCEITGIDSGNLSPDPVEITITLSGFAYEDQIPSTTIWLEP